MENNDLYEEELNQYNNYTEEEKKKILFKSIMSDYKSGKYSNLIKLTEKFHESYNTLIYWQIMYLKIISYQELLHHKLYKYFKSKKISKINNYFLSFSEVINEMIENLEKLKLKKNYSYDERDSKMLLLDINYISNEKVKRSLSQHEDNIKKENKKESKEKQKNVIKRCKIKKLILDISETIITQLLKYCYNYAKYCAYKSKVYDAIAFLSLGMNLIRKIIDYTASPEILFWSSHICLFLSSLLISTNNCLSAKNYIIFSFILCYKELELILNETNRNINNVFYIKYNSHNNILMSKIFSLISISFYQFGICFENEKNFEDAKTCYNQSKYFNNKNAFTNQQKSNFDLFIDNLMQRIYFRNKFISFILSEEKENKHLIEEKKKPKKFHNKHEIFFNKQKKRYDKIKKYIENLKIVEIDDEDPNLLNEIKGKPFSDKVGIPTKNIHLLNYLLNHKFNDFIRNTKNLQINNFSNDNFSKIRKQINLIKKEEMEKYIDHKNKSKSKQKLDDKDTISTKKLNRSFIFINSDNNRAHLLVKRVNKKSLSANNSDFSRNKMISLIKNKSNLYSKRKTEKYFDIFNKRKITNNSIFNNYNSFISNRKNKNNNKFYYSSFLDNTNRNSGDSKIKSFSKDNSKSKLLFSYSVSFNKNKINLKKNNNFRLFKISYLNDNQKEFSKKRKAFNESINLIINRNKNNFFKSNFYKSYSIKNKYIYKLKSLNKNKSHLYKLYNHDIFDKNLITKKNYLERQYNKELQFQKDVLKCKSFEKYNIDLNLENMDKTFNKQMIINNCDNFYHNKLNEISNLIELENEILPEDKIGNILKKQKTQINKKNGKEPKSQHNLIKCISKTFVLSPSKDKTNISNLLKEKEKSLIKIGNNDDIIEKQININNKNVNRNIYFLEKISGQLHKINERKNLINLKLKGK